MQSNETENSNIAKTALHALNEMLTKVNEERYFSKKKALFHLVAELVREQDDKNANTDMFPAENAGVK